MKIAVIGSRSLKIDDLEKYIPEDTTEIVSGGATGIDTCAKNYANAHHIKLTEFLPEYSHYGKCAPIIRNTKIIEYADEVIAFWDGKSRGTKYVIKHCQKIDKKIVVIHKEASDDAEVVENAETAENTEIE